MTDLSLSNREFKPLSTTVHAKFTEYCQQAYLNSIVTLTHKCTQSIAASFLNCITPPPKIKFIKKTKEIILCLMSFFISDNYINMIKLYIQSFMLTV